MRLTTWGRLVAVAGLSIACGAESNGDGGDEAVGGAGGNGGVGNTSVEGDCGAVDIACPSERPHPGAPCQGALSCEYQEDSALWTLSCDGGSWASSVECTEELIGGSCYTPPVAEKCGDPFDGTMNDSLVEIGPASAIEAFRPFESGELAQVEVGGQGSAMVFYRVRVDGEEIPSCVKLTVTLDSEAFYEPDAVTRPIVLRCGESLGMYSIVPYAECPGEGPVDATLTVAIEGIGEAVYPIQLPAEALCNAFG